MLRVKTLLLALILLVTGSAWADWVRVTGNAELTNYIDPATIQKDGDLRQVWSIQNLKEPDNESGELSTRLMEEHDCKQKRFRYLSISTHSGPMATGKTLLSIKAPSVWRNTPSNSMIEDMAKVLCSK